MPRTSPMPDPHHVADAVRRGFLRGLAPDTPVERIIVAAVKRGLAPDAQRPTPRRKTPHRER